MNHIKAATLLLFTALFLCGCKDKGYKAEDYIQLGGYIGIELESVSAKLNDEDINKAFNKLINEHTDYGIVNRPIEMYDFVNINLSAEIDGELINGFTASDYDIYLGFGSYVMDGFTESLIGLEPSKTYTISMIVPESYMEAGFIGKEIVFTVTINGVRGQIKPELNDEFIKSVSEYLTIDEYINAHVDTWEWQKEKEVNAKLKMEAWTYLVDNTICTGYPEELLAKKIEEAKETYELNAAFKGQSIEEYMIEAHGMSLEEFAKGQVKQKLMFDLIADKEKIKLTDSEYKKNLVSFAKDMGYTDKEKFVSEYGKEKIKQAMLWDKIQLFLLEKAILK